MALAGGELWVITRRKKGEADTPEGLAGFLGSLVSGFGGEGKELFAIFHAI